MFYISVRKHATKHKLVIGGKHKRIVQPVYVVTRHSTYEELVRYVDTLCGRPSAKTLEVYEFATETANHESSRSDHSNP